MVGCGGGNCTEARAAPFVRGLFRLLSVVVDVYGEEYWAPDSRDVPVTNEPCRPENGELPG
jgi:hypothetical protein